ncbi:Uncharacterized protein TCM_038185 [Theobroma cacao]|uniref:Uncharacterized protein n=1 Tax=Theobroma cacao TaxID=3641 RepID=A0A061GP00_THECC|nr:Uncharacterized protein TCM_038185 [Theobroma cacao]
MPKTCFTLKVRYGEPGRVTLGKKRKGIATTSLLRKLKVLKNSTCVTTLDNAEVLDAVGLFYKKFNIKGKKSPLKYRDHTHELIALLIMWLPQYVLPSCLNDEISSSIIPYAIKITKGISFPFVALYLGLCIRS